MKVVCVVKTILDMADAAQYKLPTSLALENCRQPDYWEAPLVAAYPHRIVIGDPQEGRISSAMGTYPSQCKTAIYVMTNCDHISRPVRPQEELAL